MISAVRRIMLWILAWVRAPQQTLFTFADVAQRRVYPRAQSTSIVRSCEDSLAAVQHFNKSCFEASLPDSLRMVANSETAPRLVHCQKFRLPKAALLPSGHDLTGGRINTKVTASHLSGFI